MPLACSSPLSHTPKFSIGSAMTRGGLAVMPMKLPRPEPSCMFLKCPALQSGSTPVMKELSLGHQHLSCCPAVGSLSQVQAAFGELCLSGLNNNLPLQLTLKEPSYQKNRKKPDQ